ncbi:MAG: hypothetical protein A2Y82_03455 [Candidatus Buchananbacteria bacterium RBG_13_36_9]|uniref:Uncharacterized protein n=1 Tax=Candidatus Buchananbacteria bacterium RBG_13_36_9 TaxID=1797530 RepID=A0A1G1XMU1_9BACT|nr:MAG: hypothetical protein A2Y82_03455 [Candidatus Buchananbacteria bacterium RBG_13_36_9]
MVPVYYFDDELKICPVKNFLSKYSPSVSDSDKLINKKVKFLTKIDKVILHTADNNGIAGGLFSSPVKGYDFSELRIKEGDNLVRIFYFCNCDEKLVLLNALEKPEHYEKGRKNKIEKLILEQLEITEIYRTKFLNNPQNYENYE